MTDTPNHVHVCDDCAAGIVNDDWSYLDYHPESADEYEQRIAAFLEMTGYLTPNGCDDNSGYFNCDCCADVCLGARRRFIADRPYWNLG